MENILYWLWLTAICKFSTQKIAQLLTVFGNIENIYLSKNFNELKRLGEKDRTRLLKKDLSAAWRIAEKCKALGSEIITYDDEKYPKILKQIASPPYVLYVKGSMPDFDETLSIGVVGTRKSTKYGETVTARLCGELAKNGVITVSGLAEGIDAAGAWAAIENGGIVVGVIGSGIDIIYPPHNIDLYKEIVKRGCIITEYPPSTRPAWYNFPMRNRIIAGLTRGVAVTQAPEKSGALITARHAIENNRDVFSVPGSITEEKCAGTNKLIQQGAKLISCAEDILSEYPYAKRMEVVSENTDEIKVTIHAAKNVREDKINNLKDIEFDIASLLIKGDMQIDEIVRELSVPVGEVNTKLVMLEMKGIVKKLPAGVYQLKL